MAKKKCLLCCRASKREDAIDDALQSTYGFDLAGFQDEWRTSYALPVIKEITQGQTQNPTPVSTIIPIQGVSSSVLSTLPTPTEEESQTSGSVERTQGSGIMNWLSGHLLLILIIVGVNCLLFVVIMLLVRRKGAK